MRTTIPLLTILPVSLSNLSSSVSFNYLANQPPVPKVQSKCCTLKRKAAESSAKLSSSIITLTSSPVKLMKFWIKDLNLSPYDKMVILSPYQWLNDNVINAAQTLLKKETGYSIKGFQNTQFGKTCKFDSVELGEKFIQILHVDSNHWITVSNIGCLENDRQSICGINPEIKTANLLFT